MNHEVMPVGTREAMTKAAQLFRSYEKHHADEAGELKRAADAMGVPGSAAEGYRIQARSRWEKAERNREAAEMLEALLVQPGVV